MPDHSHSTCDVDVQLRQLHQLACDAGLTLAAELIGQRWVDDPWQSFTPRTEMVSDKPTAERDRTRAQTLDLQLDELYRRALAADLTAAAEQLRRERQSDPWIGLRPRTRSIDEIEYAVTDQLDRAARKKKLVATAGLAFMIAAWVVALLIEVSSPAGRALIAGGFIVFLLALRVADRVSWSGRSADREGAA